MHVPINEPISVTGTYKSGRFLPLRFSWRDKIVKVDQLTLVSDVKDGGVKKRFYSVVAQGNAYRISFNRDSEVWILSEVYCE